MKKILLTLTLIFTLTLAGCDVLSEEDTSEGITLSQAELEDLIEEMVEERVEEQQTNIDYTIEGFEDAVTDMIEEARSGVLGLSVISSYSGGTGSGVIYKREGDTYYMVTNDHVVVHTDDDGVRYQPESITIVYEENGLLFQITDTVELLGSDPTTDLAVVRFTTTENFAVIPLADSYEVEPGQFVFAVGNPLGFDYYGTVTMGVVSGAARYYQDGELFDATLLQHDAAISPGNSGGALLNLNGELIGINNMKLIDDYVSNIGFAIPSNTVKRITADLEDDGIITRPYLGVSTYALINDCGLDFGVCISVAEGGAADNAALIDGDIIVGYKNEGMTEFLEINNFNDLREAILNSSVGETIVLQYYRDVNEDSIYTNDELFESNETVLNVHPDDQ